MHLNPRSLSNRQLYAEQRAYQKVMEIFARRYCDLRTATPHQIKLAMDRMAGPEIECIGAANNLVMGLNGLRADSPKVIHL